MRGPRASSAPRGDARADPGLREVLPGLWRIRIPLATHGLGHVNAYALVTDGRAVLIDTGWLEPGTETYLEEVLRAVGTSVADLYRVLLTHFHSDHCGLAGHLRSRGGATIAIHAADEAMLRSRYKDPDLLRRGTADWLHQVGAPPGLSGPFIERAAAVIARVVPFEPDEDLTPGSVTRLGPWELVAIHTPGHSPGHVCFYERTTRTLFTGDHIFARIRTSPELRPHYDGDPIGEYLRSLTTLTGLDVARVLPGHGDPIADLGVRAEELRAYHRTQMDRCVDAVAAGASTAWQVARAIPRRRSWASLNHGLQISAVGQALGHLVHLERTGAVALTAGEPLRWTVAGRHSAEARLRQGVARGSGRHDQ